MNTALTREEIWEGIAEAAERGRLKLAGDRIVKTGKAAETGDKEEK